MKILSEQQTILTPVLMSNRTPRERMDVSRSPGLHVQAINKALGVAAGKVTDSDLASYPFEKFSDSLYPLLPALGVAWEEFRASLYSESELLWQPCELERDGIYGTPDGFLDSGAIWECKLTTAKIKSVADCWMYLKQGLAYCAMSGRRRVVYDILWVLGDYSRPYQPIGTVTEVEFESREIEAWWKAVVRAGKNVKGEGE